MNQKAEIVDYKGKEAINLVAGKYSAIIAPFVGSNVIRLQDIDNKIEFFRFDETLTPDELIESAEVYGLPTLYLPNRLNNGILKVSDATYNLPINDSLGNHIHGFLHKRAHTIIEVSILDNKSIARTEYIYDEKDEFYQYFPVNLKAEYLFELSDEGLSYEFTITNTSNKQLPFGVCNHTTINAPFIENGKPLDTRLYVPIGDKWELNKKCIPTCDFLPYTDHDKQYLTGSMVPVKHVLDNDMYFAEIGQYKDAPYYGIIATDIKTNKSICYEVCKDYKFWIIWNDRGEKGYFCPEPMTWTIDAPNLPLSSDESGYCELAPGESKTLTQKIYSE